MSRLDFSKIPAAPSEQQRWKVIEVGILEMPELSEWCVFHPPGPPNSNHPRTTDRVLAEGIAALLNWRDYRESRGSPERTE